MCRVKLYQNFMFQVGNFCTNTKYYAIPTRDVLILLQLSFLPLRCCSGISFSLHQRSQYRPRKWKSITFAFVRVARCHKEIEIVLHNAEKPRCLKFPLFRVRVRLFCVRGLCIESLINCSFRDCFHLFTICVVIIINGTSNKLHFVANF